MDDVQWLERKINLDSTEPRESVNPDQQRFTHHVQLVRTLMPGGGQVLEIIL